VFLETEVRKKYL